MKKLLFPLIILIVGVAGYAYFSKKQAPPPSAKNSAARILATESIGVAPTPLARITALLRPIAVYAAMAEDTADAQRPLPCDDPSSCESYCREHMQACMEFGKSKGAMRKDDAEKMEAFVSFMAQGKTPGGCANMDACEAYCLAGAHMDECMAFARSNGFATEKEIELFRRTGGKGPGGCAGQACEAYCNDAAHREECMAWAKEYGAIGEGEIRMMREGMKMFKDHVGNLPADVVSCMKSAVGDGVFGQMMAGEPVFTSNLNLTMQPCFAGIVEGTPYGAPPGATIIPMGGRLPVDQFPSEVVACIETKFGAEFVAGIKTGAVSPSEEQGKAISECFARLKPSPPTTVMPGQ